MTNGHGLFLSDEGPDPQILLDWLRAQGAIVSDAVRISETEAGWGIVATREIGPDELILNVPKTSILSARTTSLVLPPELLLPSSGTSTDTVQVSTNRTIPTLALVVLHELRLGKDGKFWGYLQSLPREVGGLPSFWDKESEERKWLRGTEAYRELIRRDEAHMGLQDLILFYEATRSLLPTTAAHPSPSPVESYLYAYSLVTTRAFLIDIYHTLALVPFADILNHSSTDPHTSLASDDFVCYKCGSLRTCSHDTPSSSSLPDRLSHLDPITRARIQEEEDTIEMRAERSVGEGEEVMNTYGKGIGDGKLLVDWGFVGGEYAGPGLEWDLNELLGIGRVTTGASDGDEDSNFKARERCCLDVIERGAVALELFPDHHDDENEEEYQDENEDNLLCPPLGKSPNRPSEEPVFNLNHNGQISLNIWIALYDQTSPPSELPISKSEKLDARLVKSVRMLEAAHIDPRPHPAGDTGAGVERTCKAVISLLERRLEGMYRPELEVDVLLDLRDEEARDRKMAMTLAIDERVLLHSALSEWRALVSRLPGVVD